MKISRCEIAILDEYNSSSLLDVSSSRAKKQIKQIGRPLVTRGEYSGSPEKFHL